MQGCRAGRHLNEGPLKHGRLSASMMPSLCCWAARARNCAPTSIVEGGFRPITSLPPQSPANMSTRGTEQLGWLIMWAASFSHHRNASCCAINIVFNLAPKLSRHECKMAVKNNFFSHLHDYFLPPIYRLSSCRCASGQHAFALSHLLNDLSIHKSRPP